jgi:hypothetical protein
MAYLFMGMSQASRQGEGQDIEDVAINKTKG